MIIMAYIELKNNTKIYQSGDTQIYANKDITFSVAKGELVIILGSSVAGKNIASDKKSLLLSLVF